MLHINGRRLGHRSHTDDETRAGCVSPANDTVTALTGVVTTTKVDGRPQRQWLEPIMVACLSTDLSAA
jgi:hypothetical protein